VFVNAQAQVDSLRGKARDHSDKAQQLEQKAMDEQKQEEEERAQKAAEEARKQQEREDQLKNAA